MKCTVSKLIKATSAQSVRVLYCPDLKRENLPNSFLRALGKLALGKMALGKIELGKIELGKLSCNPESIYYFSTETFKTKNPPYKPVLKPFKLSFYFVSKKPRFIL